MNNLKSSSKKIQKTLLINFFDASNIKIMWSEVEVEAVTEVEEMTEDEVVLVIEEEVDHVIVGIEDKEEVEVVIEEVEAEVQEDEVPLTLEELNQSRKRKKLVKTITKKDIALPEINVHLTTEMMLLQLILENHHQMEVQMVVHQFHHQICHFLHPA